MFRTAQEALDRAGVYAYRHRKTRKREFRQLWNTRVSAAVKEQGWSYSRFINALKNKNVALNRKMISELAIAHPNDFAKLVAFVR